MLCRVDWINRMWQQWSDLWGLWLFHHGGFHGLLVLGPEAWVRVPGVLQVLGPAAEGHRAEDLAHGDEAAGAGRLLQTGPGCPDSCDTQGCAAPGWWRWWWWWPILHPAQVTTTTLSYFYPAHSAPPTPPPTPPALSLLLTVLTSSLIPLLIVKMCVKLEMTAVGGGRHQLTYGGPILLTAPRPAAASRQQPSQRSTQDRVNTDNFQHLGCSSVALSRPRQWIHIHTYLAATFLIYQQRQIILP